MASLGHAEVESRWRTNLCSSQGGSKNRRLIRMTAAFFLSSISISLNGRRSQMVTRFFFVQYTGGSTNHCTVRERNNHKSILLCTPFSVINRVEAYFFNCIPA